MGDLNWFWLVEVMGFVHERGTQTPPPGSRQFVSFRFVFRARVFEVVGFACLLACLLAWFFLFLFFTAATYHAGFGCVWKAWMYTCAWVCMLDR